MTNKEILESWGIDTRESMLAWCNTDLTLQNTFELMEEVRKDEREKMQGVEIFISWDSEDDEFEPQENRCSVWADRPEYDREFGTFVGNLGFECEAAAWLFNIPEEFCDMLGVDSGQCKKFRIVEVLT